MTSVAAGRVSVARSQLNVTYGLRHPGTSEWYLADPTWVAAVGESPTVALVEIVVLESHEVGVSSRAELGQLWDSAFVDRFSTHDAEHAFGGVHVLVTVPELLVGHASAVPRQLTFGDGPWRTVAYVEAVAIAPSHQGKGFCRTVMTRLQAEIDRRWPVAMLSTGRATGFYERLGWEPWQGASVTRTSLGDVFDGEQGGLMIRRPDESTVPDLTVIVTCLDRAGDAW